jgi:hypothetical protein
VRLRNTGGIRDSGLADVVDWHAIQHQPQNLPAETLRFLLPSRYCEVDSPLLNFAWNQFGATPLGDRWYTFDARHNTPRIGRIVIGRGRDAGDVALSMTFGAHSLANFTVVTREVSAC